MRICPFCSTENEAFFRFCLGCGADLDEALGPEVEAEPVVHQPTDTAPRVVTKRPDAPRVGKDTIIDLAPLTAQAVAEDFERRAQESTPEASVAGPPPAAAPASTVLPTRPPPGAGPRAPVDRQKTFDNGAQAKSASPAMQAVAQAQLDLAKKQQPIGVSPGKAASPELHTKRSGGSPELAAPVAKKAEAAPRPAAPAAPEQPRTRLVVILEDGTDGATLELSPDTTIIGREGADINFPHDDFLARHHAQFYFQDGVLHLRPLESTNGVFLQVHQEVELQSGDVFRIGQQLLCFEVLSVVASVLAPDVRGNAIPLGSPLPEGAWGRLGQLIAPDTMGSVYLLGGSEVYLGRERGDITFPGDGFVSGLHAQISQRNGRSFLKDLGSSNGTYLRLTRATPVRRGTLVLAGQQLFRIDGG